MDLLEKSNFLFSIFLQHFLLSLLVFELDNAAGGRYFLSKLVVIQKLLPKIVKKLIVLYEITLNVFILLVVRDVNEILAAIPFGKDEFISLTAVKFYLLDKLSAELHVIDNLDALHPVAVCFFDMIEIVRYFALFAVLFP